MNQQNLIEQCLQELRKQQIGKQVYLDYYEGKHDILKSYAMQDARSNMKVICNFPRRFITEEVSYSLGNPINYISINDEDTVPNLIDLNFSHWSKLHDQELLKQSQIFGEAYELQYINVDGEFRATVLNPLNCFVLEEGTADKEVVMALHLFKKQFKDKEYLDVYVGNKIIHYEVSSGKLSQVGEDTHIFNRVPVLVCGANHEKKSMIDDIKTLNDAYNSVLSDLTNEVSDFRNSYLKITGTELKEADLLEMKKLGAMKIPAGGSVDWLIKNINDSFVENLLNNIERKIYTLASHLDTNEKLQSNTSSLALRSRLISLENKCSLMQGMLEKVIKQRLRNFFEFIRIKTGKEYDYRTIKVKFTSNVPSDITSISQVITQLQNTISQETALSLLPFVENPKVELAKFIKEKEGQIDLDKIGDE